MVQLPRHEYLSSAITTWQPASPVVRSIQMATAICMEAVAGAVRGMQCLFSCPTCCIGVTGQQVNVPIQDATTGLGHVQIRCPGPVFAVILFCPYCRALHWVAVQQGTPASHQTVAPLSMGQCQPFVLLARRPSREFKGLCRSVKLVLLRNTWSGCPLENCNGSSAASTVADDARLRP